MVLMAEKPKPKKGRPKKNDDGTATIHVQIDGELAARLEAYYASLRFRPTTRDVVELALREFLDREDAPKSNR